MIENAASSMIAAMNAPHARPARAAR